MSTTMEGVLEIDHKRGVIYFHEKDSGHSRMRIQGLPTPIPNVSIMAGSQEQGYGLLDMRVESRQILVSRKASTGRLIPDRSSARNFKVRTVARAFGPEDVLQYVFGESASVSEVWITDPADDSGGETYWKWINDNWVKQ